ncbi:hypothetical protein [Streptomyces sp. NPDC005374]|uniref:hypothetical protein n=1 Tax=Streptomyces sp. NPDC005374 TaxID=3364713 RepID=UPI00367B1869
MTHSDASGPLVVAVPAVGRERGEPRAELVLVLALLTAVGPPAIDMYVLVFAVNSAGQLATDAVFSRLACHIRMNTLLTASVAVATAGALVQVMITAVAGESHAASWVTQFVVVSAFSAVVPAAITFGQYLGRTAPGAASALLAGSSSPSASSPPRWSESSARSARSRWARSCSVR